MKVATDSICSSIRVWTCSQESKAQYRDYSGLFGDILLADMSPTAHKEVDDYIGSQTVQCDWNVAKAELCCTEHFLHFSCQHIVRKSSQSLGEQLKTGAAT